MTSTQSNVTLIKIYLYFRTVLAALLVSMFILAPANNIFGTVHPNLFLWTAAAYLLVCITTFIFRPPDRLNDAFNQIIVSLTIDVLSILMLLHASGGVESGLGYLLLIFVAMAGIFIRGQMGIAFAAMTSLFVMGETVYLLQFSNYDSKSVFSAGSLGILLFCTVFAFQFLTEKIRTSNLEALTQARYAEHLQKLAQAIVTRMRTGILVVDGAGRIELINDSALQLLDLPLGADYSGVLINEVASLQAIVTEWQDNPAGGPPKVLELRAGQRARISFSTLDLGSSSRIVIYLEDHRVMAQHAQQLKLASLGRLTASIAHEVRNPLGAISHAAQLLAESTSITKEDLRLTEIIHQHSLRVNHIVESTLSLSRRKEPQPEALNLNLWMPRFLTQYQTGQNLDIDLQMESQQHLIKIDPTHLSQVLTNLLDNGIRYSQKATGKARVLVRVNQSQNDETHYIDIIDFGGGISEDQLPQIFDPFYTTDAKGSGLGLYISKELCEINQANLHYRRTSEGHSCFRIEFSHYQRMF